MFCASQKSTLVRFASKVTEFASTDVPTRAEHENSEKAGVTPVDSLFFLSLFPHQPYIFHISFYTSSAHCC